MKSPMSWRPIQFALAITIVMILVMFVLTGCASAPCPIGTVSYPMDTCIPAYRSSGPYYQGDVSDQTHIQIQSEWLREIK